jgi:hypothetical protein
MQVTERERERERENAISDYIDLYRLQMGNGLDQREIVPFSELEIPRDLRCHFYLTDRLSCQQIMRAFRTRYCVTLVVARVVLIIKYAFRVKRESARRALSGTA